MMKYLGAQMIKIETEEERLWLRDNLYQTNYYSGVRWDDLRECYVWYDGTPVDLEMFPNLAERIDCHDQEISFVCTPYDDGAKNGHLIQSGTDFMLFEIPAAVLPTNITFANYVVTMDTGASYQLAPQSEPKQLPVNCFLYESSDETVLTVNDTGLVTPVGRGTADVWVYSLDKAVKNRVTITVKDPVALEGLSFPTDSALIAVGENLALGCILTPANTTRNHVIYTSSDNTIATVDDAGTVSALAKGTVTITATCEGFKDTITITVYTKAVSLMLDNMTLCASVADGTLELPKTITNPGADLDLVWRSTDETVATVENGKLILKAAGTTSLVATDRRSGLNATCLVIVGQSAIPAVRDVKIDYNRHLVLLESGDLYFWDLQYATTPILLGQEVELVNMGSSESLTLQEDGMLRKYHLYTSSLYYEEITTVVGWDIVEMESYGDDQILVRTADGSVYAWGHGNDYGELGVGSVGTVDMPTLVNLDGVVDIVTDSHTTWFLTDKGELYAAGMVAYTSYASPTLIDTGVSRIGWTQSNGQFCVYYTISGHLKYYGTSTGNNLFVLPEKVTALDSYAMDAWTGESIGIRDGKIYTFNCGTGVMTLVPGITDAIAVYDFGETHYIATESGLLFGLGRNDTNSNHMAGVTTNTNVTAPLVIPLVPIAEENITLTDTSLEEGVMTGDTLVLTFNKELGVASPRLYANGVQITMQSSIQNANHLIIQRTAGWAEDVSYELVFEAGSIHAAGGATNEEEIRISFAWMNTSTEVEPEPDEKVIYEAIVDHTIQRQLTPQSVLEKLREAVEKTQYNPFFTGNAILNPIATDTDVSHWLRPLAPSVEAGKYVEIPLGGNWWGSTNETAIGLQMIDYTDFVTYGRLMYAPYLTEAPENTFPFVTSVKLFNRYGEEVTTVGNEQVTFQVKFNRDMDTSIPLSVRFGSAYPYGDYEITGKYVDARTWEGTYTLNTLIENGNQYFTISNGCSATDDLELQLDRYRFGFVIDTTAAQALIMQGSATNTGIQLKWTQDDFQTLMGYNVYRSTSEDGLYTRLNSTVIPADTMEWFDDAVEPGVVYYYNFTVVQTDLTESEPSGKIVIMSKDTMAPNIYHSPVANAFTGSNLVLSATITDNLNIAYANLYYRIAGTGEWYTIRMNKLNDKYSAIIPAQHVTLDGIEYYIEAFDGVSFTYKGSQTAPYAIAVQEAIDVDALGDVDGDGAITNLDALLLLYAINDKYNMTAEEFARADLNGDGELWAAEALRILQYVNGVVGSVKM